MDHKSFPNYDRVAEGVSFALHALIVRKRVPDGDITTEVSLKSCETPGVVMATVLEELEGEPRKILSSYRQHACTARSTGQIHEAIAKASPTGSSLKAAARMPDTAAENLIVCFLPEKIVLYSRSLDAPMVHLSFKPLGVDEETGRLLWVSAQVSPVLGGGKSESFATWDDTCDFLARHGICASFAQVRAPEPEGPSPGR